MSQDKDSSDGFITIRKIPGATRMTSSVYFVRKGLSLRPPDACLPMTRADLQWHPNGTLRIRLGEEGEYAVSHNGKSNRQISAGSLMKTIGRVLFGDYRVTKVDGCDIYVDVGDDTFPWADQGTDE